VKQQKVPFVRREDSIKKIKSTRFCYSAASDLLSLARGTTSLRADLAFWMVVKRITYIARLAIILDNSMPSTSSLFVEIKKYRSLC
jgi:hypothetical protein